MSEQPLLSIITVNLNNLEGLKKTMESVFNQTWKEFEYIVIDGGSTDGSKEYIQKQTKELSHWVSELDTGVYNAMNKGLKKAKGNFLLFLNSGDWLYTNLVLSNIHENFNSQEGFLYGDILKILEDGKEVLEKGSRNITLKTFLEGSINHQALFINKKIFEVHGPYDERYSIVSDWKLDLLALGLNKSSLKLLDQIISYYPLDGISMNFELRDKEREEVIKELVPDSILKDYKKFSQQEIQLKSNRYKMFMAMEDDRIARKFNSGLFRILLFIFTGKRLKDLQ